jgi:hypothetical protein
MGKNWISIFCHGHLSKHISFIKFENIFVSANVDGRKLIFSLLNSCALVFSFSGSQIYDFPSARTLSLNAP